jgi:hypothetical protein
MHELLRELESPDPDVALEAYAKVPDGPLPKAMYRALIQNAYLSVLKKEHEVVWSVLSKHANDPAFKTMFHTRDEDTKRFLSRGLNAAYRANVERPFCEWCFCVDNGNKYKPDPDGPLANMRRAPKTHDDFSRDEVVALI